MKLMYPVQLAPVWTGYPTNFPFQNHFCNLIEFPMEKIFKIQYLLYLISKKIQITFIKS
jgi:hypothetical protein